MKQVGFISGFFYFFLCFSFSGLAGTKEEIIRLQSDILQLQNQIRLVKKGADESNAILKSLLEQLNDQIATTNLTIDNLTKVLRDALVIKYEGEIAASKANIQVYLHQSVGIGEHSNLSVEIHKWTSKLTEAIENINSLKEYFTEDGYGHNKTKKILND